MIPSRRIQSKLAYVTTEYPAFLDSNCQQSSQIEIRLLQPSSNDRDRNYKNFKKLERQIALIPSTFPKSLN